MEPILFKELNISEELKKAIEDMGFEEATPVQGQSILPMLEGHDMVAQAPTGTGKTCAFGIPIVDKISPEEKKIEALVLCPTRELVIQTTNEILKLKKYKEGSRVVPIYGGQNIERQISALKRRPQIIVATPGRLMDHMRRRTIRLENLRYLVLDEADEMLDMGFRDDIEKIVRKAPEERQTVLFSATMSKEILGIAKKYLEEPIKVQITKSEVTVPSIAQYYLEVGSGNKTEVLARLIDVHNYKLSIVFCNTKRMVDELAREMTARGYSAEGLHGDMRQQQRDRVMNKFKSGQVEILIATDVAARGIDVDDVEAVFNYDLPDDMEYYVHRIGRTGRANRSGVSYTFVGHKEMYHLREIMNYTKAKIQFMQVPDLADIADVRTSKELKELARIIRKGKQKDFTEIIEKFLGADENSDCTTMDIAAAALCRLLKADELKPSKSGPGKERDRKGRDGKSRNRKDRERKESGDRSQNEKFRDKVKEKMPVKGRKKGQQKGMVRLFLNMGKVDKMKKKFLEELLVERVGISEKKISAIDVLDKYSFINVSPECVEPIMEELNGERFDGKRLSIEEANHR